MLKLVHYLYELLRPFRLTIVIIIILNTCIGFISQYALFSIVEKSNYGIQLMIFSFASEWLINILLELITFKIQEFISQVINDKEFRRYSYLDAKSRNLFPTTTFSPSLKDFEQTISMTTNNCMFNLANIIETIITTFILFIQRGYFPCLGFLILFHCIWYYFISKSTLTQMKIVRDIFRSAGIDTEEEIQLILPDLQQKKQGVEDILEQKNKYNTKRYAMNLGYIKFFSSTHASGKITALMFIVYWYYTSDTASDLLVLFTLILKFNYLIMDSLRQYTQFIKADATLEKYEKQWDKLVSKPPLIQKTIPVTGLVYESVNLKEDGFTLQATNLEIKPGETVIVRGKTGSGKSYLLSSLIGDTSGATLRNGEDPGSYETDFSMAYQLNSFPSSGITIRKLLKLKTFNHECDIWSFLDDLDLAGWLKKKCSSSKNEVDNKKATFEGNSRYPIFIQLLNDLWTLKTVDKNEKLESDFHPFDVNITGPSGGEIKRLITLKALWRAHITKANSIILDEPEAGIDPPAASQILKNILKNPRIKDKNKIIVTHLCDCQLQFIQRNVIWHVHDGVVDVTKMN